MMTYHDDMETSRDDSIIDVTELLHAERSLLGDRAADAIFATLSSYAGIDRESVRTSVGTNIARAIETLRSRLAPQPGTSAEASTTTLERARQGVPIEDIIRAYRLSLRVIHDRFLELATSRGIPAELILDCSNLLWEVGDWFTGIAATEYRNHAVRDTVRRAELLHELLGGRIDQSRLRSLTTTLGLDVERQYSVFYAVPSSGKSLEETGISLPNSQVPFEIVIESAGRYLGLAPGRDFRKQSRFIVARGPAVQVHELAESERIASAILSLVHDREPGTYRLEDVSWRLAANGEPAVARHLDEKYLKPLDSHGEFGALLIESVRTYLNCDRSVATTAERLVVHPNTLRYRLTRYEEIVQASLASTETVVELMWILESKAATRKQ